MGQLIAPSRETPGNEAESHLCCKELLLTPHNNVLLSSQVETTVVIFATLFKKGVIVFTGIHTFIFFLLVLVCSRFFSFLFVLARALVCISAAIFFFSNQIILQNTPFVCFLYLGDYDLLLVEFSLQRRLGFHMIQVKPAQLI